MIIAVMASEPTLEGTVPDTFETAPALVLIETETENLLWGGLINNPEEAVERILKSECEAIVCGIHIGEQAFTPIADACVTRYDGTGLNVLQAAKRADIGTLALIPDFEGGHGCGSGTGECHHEHEEKPDED